MKNSLQSLLTRKQPAGLLLLGLGLAGCNLQNDINVPLPAYANQLAVECYLEPGAVPLLTVTESQAYLAPLSGNAIAQAVPLDVTALLTLPGGRVVSLRFAPMLDTVARRGYTHFGQEPIVARPGDTFTLDVQDQRGRRVTGTATMTSYVPIDSVSYKFNDRSGTERKAYFLTNFQDQAGTEDYYRLSLHKGQPAKGALLRKPESDFNLQDRLNDGQAFKVGTSYRFEEGDTVTSTLYHIDKGFFYFRQSVSNARQANGNPFAQPSAIYSTVQGGLGVFTILNYERKTLIIK